MIYTNLLECNGGVSLHYRGREVVQGSALLSGGFRLLQDPAIKVAVYQVWIAVGARCKMEESLSQRDFLFSAWPHLASISGHRCLTLLQRLPCTEPPASIMWLSTRVPLLLSARMIIRYCVETNQFFLPVTLRTFIYFTPKTIRWVVSLNLIPRSLRCVHDCLNPICCFWILCPCGLMANNLQERGGPHQTN